MSMIRLKAILNLKGQAQCTLEAGKTVRSRTLVSTITLLELITKELLYKEFHMDMDYLLILMAITMRGRSDMAQPADKDSIKPKKYPFLDSLRITTCMDKSNKKVISTISEVSTSVASGDYKNGRRSGYGEYSNFKDQTICRGMWDEGVLEGNG